MQYQKGDQVSWPWGSGKADGEVQSVFHEKTVRKIKGTEVVRHGSNDNPAVYIKQNDGTEVLKLASEVSPK